MLRQAARCVCGKQFQLTCWNWNRTSCRRSLHWRPLDAQTPRTTRKRTRAFLPSFVFSPPSPQLLLPVALHFHSSGRRVLCMQKLAVHLACRGTFRGHARTEGAATDNGNLGREKLKKFASFLPAKLPCCYLHLNRKSFLGRSWAVHGVFRPWME